MNVAVYCSQITEKAGGGFTFQAEILQSLAELAESSQHIFRLLVPSSDGFDEYTRSGHIKISVLPRQASSRHVPNKWWQKHAKKILGMDLPVVKSNVKTLSDHTSVISSVVKEQGIHLIWFIGPTFEEVPDVPYLATVWDLQHRLQPFFPEVSSNGVWDYREMFFTKYLQRAAFVITGSRIGQAEVEKFYQIPSERMKVLPHPTPEFALNPPDIDADSILERLGVQGDYLFYPAQFWAHKNHVNLLLALDVLRKKHMLTLKIIFVGSDQGNEAHVRKMVDELDLSTQVNILGFVSRDELTALYKKAIVLTYMTLFGPNNLPPLEAFALGCPVIASDISGAREQLADSAMFVNPANPEEIADAIFSIYNKPQLRARLIERGHDHARHWTSKDFTQGVFAILDEFERIRRCWA